jgi:hypothetical protein
MARIFVAEDERDLALFCHRALTSEGHGGDPRRQRRG